MKAANRMSLSVDLEIQDKLKAIAKKRDISVSKLIRELVEKNFSNSDEEVATVILKIPKNLSVEDLTKWLSLRTTAIVKSLAKRE